MFLKLFFFNSVALVLLTTGVPFVITKNVLWLLVMLVYLFLVVMSYYCFRHVYKFTETTIKTTLDALQPHSADLFKNYFFKNFLFAVLISMCRFSLLEIGFAKREHRTFSKYVVALTFYFCCFFLILNLTYTTFLHGVAFCNEQMHKTVDAWDRAFEIANYLSQGSVALVSMLMSLVYTVGLAVENERSERSSNANLLFFAVFSCLFDLLDELLEFLSAQSLIYVAIYGKSFCKSGKMGFQSLKQKGFEKYLSWNVVSQLLSSFGFFWIDNGSFGWFCHIQCS